MSAITDEAIILKTHKLGESDKILTILTANYGKIKAVARGSRKTTSSFGAKTANFSHIKLNIAKGKTLDIVTQIRILESHFDKISASFNKFICANLICDFTDSLISELYIRQFSVFRLLKNALLNIVNTTYEKIYVDIYLLQFLEMMGYKISLKNYNDISDNLLVFYLNSDINKIILYSNKQRNKISRTINEFISSLPL
ncbi:MAG: DNA repair protein RecO [Bifidobacteriaceae bacterium]|jgi:DNA repair protein RecO (recombination protein O)|nr:DNA repair protein RecO [Bifidobacteriaceae bacterium]